MSRKAKGEGSTFRTETGWRGYVTANGKRKYVSGRTKQEVASKIRDLLNQRDTTGITTGKSITLKTWLAHWVSIKDFTPKAQELTQYVINNWIPENLQQVRLSSLTVEKVETFYTDLASSTLSPSTQARIHTVLSSALTTARERGHLKLNPAQQALNRPRPGKAKIETLSETDALIFLDSLTGLKDRAKWELSFGLGPRPGEVLGLEWSKIDFDQKRIVIDQQLQRVNGDLILVGQTKSGKARILPLPDYLADLLQSWRQQQLLDIAAVEDFTPWSPDGEPHSWVFTSYLDPGKPITPDGDRAQFRRLLERAGLPYVRPYVSRHTAASVLIAKGVDPATVADLLGHSSVKTTFAHYVHALSDRKEALRGFLDGQRGADKVQDKVQTKKALRSGEATKG